MTVKLRILLISIGLILSVISCQENIEEACGVSYEKDLKPITETACTGYCHTSFDHFSIYDNIKEVVDNGLLKEKLITSREMPLYPRFISEEQRSMFECWIEAGGPNN